MKKQRTWFRTTAFKGIDYVVVAAVLAALAVFVYLRILDPGIWVPA
ncbi:MAG: hypothetical protein JRM88_03365 [Nitrososphaerota archaeon]|nr:hypothetical protein [Nitrososphaerota archaeon]